MELLHVIIVMQRHSVAAHPVIQEAPLNIMSTIIGSMPAHFILGIIGSSFAEITSWAIIVVFLALVAQPVENVLKILLSLF
jgi:hypothetical protein